MTLRPTPYFAGIVGLYHRIKWTLFPTKYARRAAIVCESHLHIG